MMERIKEYTDLFNQYVKNFDLKDKMILLKFHHTYRVMEYARRIALSIGADSFKAVLCSLFHDIARFHQWTKYHTFHDSVSVDYGNLGVIILKEKFKNLPYFDLVLFTTRNHNKLAIEKTNNEEYVLYTKIVRDADKMDILLEQGNTMDENNLEINKNVIKSIWENKMIKKEDVKNEADNILKLLSFTFDIYFNYTYQWILENRIIENKIHLLTCYVENKELEKIEKILKEYINKKVEDNYVRE